MTATADRRRAALDASRQRARAKLVSLEPGAPLSEGNLRNLRQADRERELAEKAAGSGRKHDAKRHMAKARELTDKVTADRIERTDNQWIGAALDETATLELGRGEEVERTRTGGLRIRSRDGLASLAKPLRETDAVNPVKPLTTIQYRAGLMYRDILDAARESVPSQLGGMQAGSGAPHDPDRKSWAQRRAEATARLVSVERAVLQTLREPRAVTLLRQVAGLGVPLTQLSTSGSARDKDGRVLRLALDVAATHFRVAERRKVEVVAYETSDHCAFGEAQEGLTAGPEQTTNA